MGRRVHLGHVLGVEIAVDWSWVFTFVLALWTLTSVGGRVFPTLHPGALVILSVAAAIGLFASLAVHEIAHGLAARACGVPVRKVTLFLFGGITDVERDPASPRSEAIAAIAAPLTNAALGGALVGLGFVLGGMERVAGMLVSWFGGVNLALAVFNLVPAYPLDGGRLVRAAVWRATGDVEKATRWSAWMGQAVGWLAVALGVGLAFTRQGIGVAGGMWVAFVGWFLASAAAQAYQGVRVQNALAGVKVSRLMRRRFQALPADISVATALRAWPSDADDLLPVVDRARLVGVVSLAQLRAVRADRVKSTLVSELLAAPEGVVVSPPDEAASAYAKLAEQNVDRLPVVEADRLVGLLERADIERWIESHVANPAPV